MVLNLLKSSKNQYLNKFIINKTMGVILGESFCKVISESRIADREPRTRE